MLDKLLTFNIKNKINILNDSLYKKFYFKLINFYLIL